MYALPDIHDMATRVFPAPRRVIRVVEMTDRIGQRHQITTRTYEGFTSLIATLRRDRAEYTVIA